MTVFLASGKSSLTELPAIRVGLSITAIQAGDLDGDGLVDLALVADNRITALWGRGNGSFDGPFLDDFRGVASMALGDADGDGTTEIVASYAGGVVRTFRAAGARLELVGEESFIGRSSSAIELADMNGDGRQDLILQMEDRIDVRLGDGSGTFADGLLRTASVRDFFLLGMPLPQELQIVDVDQDGILDVVSPFAADGLFLLRGQGDGGFRQPGFFGCCRRLVAFEDLDRNGRLDVVSTDDAASITVYLDHRQ